MFAIETKDMDVKQSNSDGYNRPHRIKAWSRQFVKANICTVAKYKQGEVSYLQHKDAAMQLACKLCTPGNLPTHWSGGRTATGWVWVAV